MTLNRAEPALPVTAYKTYGIAAPRATHSRPATCAEVDCAAWKNGWKTIVPTVSPQADYIRNGDHGRHYVWRGAEAGMTEFEFPPGQVCFRASEHTISLHREPIFTVRGGDWRAVTSPVRRHTRAEDFVEDWALNQQAIADAQKRGAI
jgi:hypothetical protein